MGSGIIWSKPCLISGSRTYPVKWKERCLQIPHAPFQYQHRTGADAIVTCPSADKRRVFRGVLVGLVGLQCRKAIHGDPNKRSLADCADKSALYKNTCLVL